MAGTALAKLAGLAGKAGRWLGLAVPQRHTGAVESDRFDEMTWREITDQGAAVRDVIDDLGERHDYAANLVHDVFLAAYKTAPVVRSEGDMDRSRLVNRAAISALLESPEFGELRRETAGDAYASAMAVLAMAETLRRMLEQAEDAQQAAGAAARAAEEEHAAAGVVAAAMATAGDAAGEDGSVPDEAAEGVAAAIGAAEQAGQDAVAAGQAASQALAGAAPGMRAALRSGAAQAANERQAEAALFAGILFSSAGEIKVFRFPAREPVRIADVLDFAEFFWGGGTNFEEPLGQAMDLLEAEFNDDGAMRGDIALVTDGICGVSEDWMRAWNERKAALGFRLFGIQVGRAPGAVLEALSDNVRAVTDLADVDRRRVLPGEHSVYRRKCLPLCDSVPERGWWPVC
jgi:hypothetical protein